MADSPRTLAEPARDWIAQRVASGDWPDESAYLSDLVARDREQAEKLAFVRDAIAVSKAGGISNRSLADIITEGRARH